MSAVPISNCASTSSVDRGFLADGLRGLSGSPKWIPSKHLYDKRGSELFDQICQLDEYYVTRCEMEIMHRHAGEMAAALGSPVRLVEFGSGSSVKTRLLLDHLCDRSIYLPVDVSAEHLAESAAQLRLEYPDIEVRPIQADFSCDFSLPSDAPGVRVAVYFPGSTIGNFEHHTAKRLLRRIRMLCGLGGELLIGIDLRKDPQVTQAAYDDAQGVTAEFTYNLLLRMNRELAADFNRDAFSYRAVYDEDAGRIEASLVSKREQTVSLAGQVFHLEHGEAIRTEYSHKYTLAQFDSLAASAGFERSRTWTDEKDWFAVLLLKAVR